jgi:hypothetical protein
LIRSERGSQGTNDGPRRSNHNPENRKSRNSWKFKKIKSSGWVLEILTRWHWAECGCHEMMSRRYWTEWGVQKSWLKASYWVIGCNVQLHQYFKILVFLELSWISSNFLNFSRFFWFSWISSNFLIFTNFLSFLSIFKIFLIFLVF